MRYRFALFVLASAAFAGGCTTAGSSPATTPDMPETTTTRPEITPTTTLAPRTTTTIDRLLEIQAIFEDLERRRLQAIFDQDEEAFRSVYANDAYWMLEVETYAILEVLDPEGVMFKLEDATADEGACIATRVTIDARRAFVGGSVSATTIVVEKNDGRWGYSWVGEGWACDGSHPLSP